MESEKSVVSTMIMIYCNKNHSTPKNTLCDECESLKKYAHIRLDNCRYGKNKGFCAHCPTQCYAKQQKENMGQVMKFSGPRMLFYTPHLLVKHMFITLLYKIFSRK